MRYAIGVDLGGTSLRVAAVDEAGHVLDRVSLPVRTLAGREAVVETLCEAARSLIAKYQARGALAGVGVGVPGIIYLDTGRLRQSPNLPGWENYPVRDEIEQRLGVRVILDNDANAAALGEKWRGAGRDVDSLCLITLGTGVGGGLICHGRIWHGFLGMAGELGHITVAENGVRCGCGNIGCLETETSATAVARKAKQAMEEGRSPALSRASEPGQPLTAEAVCRCAEAGDPACREIYESLGRTLGIGVAGLVNALNLPLYVIGGGVAEAWGQFSPALFEELRRRSYVFAEGRTRVEKSPLRGEGGLLGAAYLALQRDAPGLT